MLENGAVGAPIYFDTLLHLKDWGCCGGKLMHTPTHNDKASSIPSTVQSLGDSHGGGAKHVTVVTSAVAANNVNNARAIENGVMWMTIIPCALKIIVYGVRLFSV